MCTNLYIIVVIEMLNIMHIHEQTKKGKQNNIVYSYDYMKLVIHN